jgi:hypothetical protein
VLPDDQFTVLTYRCSWMSVASSSSSASLLSIPAESAPLLQNTYYVFYLNSNFSFISTAGNTSLSSNSSLPISEPTTTLRCSNATVVFVGVNKTAQPYVLLLGLNFVGCRLKFFNLSAVYVVYVPKMELYLFLGIPTFPVFPLLPLHTTTLQFFRLRVFYAEVRLKSLK